MKYSFKFGGMFIAMLVYASVVQNEIQSDTSLLHLQVFAVERLPYQPVSSQLAILGCRGCHPLGNRDHSSCKLSLAMELWHPGRPSKYSLVIWCTNMAIDHPHFPIGHTCSIHTLAFAMLVVQEVRCAKY